MNAIRIPRKLDIARSCYFELPNDVEARELVLYAAEYRRQYGSVFHSRIGHLFLFQLPTADARDRFLLALAMGCTQQGLRTKFTHYYPEA